MMRIFESAVRLAVIAALGGTLCVLAGVAGGSLHWSLDLAGQFLLPAFAVSASAALVGALFGWRWLASATAVAAIAAYLVAMPWTAPPAAVPKEATRFTVLLFNVWFANWHLDDVRKTIERTNADMVVLVEATPRVRDAMQSLGSLYPYRLDCIGTARCDILIYGRSRLVAHETRATRDPEHSPLVIAETDLGGCKLTLFATHMTRPFPNRPYWAQRAQAEEIAADVVAAPGAKLVLGDFNAAPWGYVVSTIEKLGGVSVLTGPGGTWPSILPPQFRIPIDHVLAGPGLTFVSRRVLGKLGSDHVPVLAEIAVTDPTQCR